ncbi:MAG: hypothetical protein M3Y86_04660, partial [Verrucomicrobiota bacterium]|nr:hypothetical protein [Verrucomicrobiota bacterium]
LKSLLRRMVQKVDEDLETFTAGEFSVKVAVRFLGLGKIAEFQGRLLHTLTLSRAKAVPSEKPLLEFLTPRGCIPSRAPCG